MHLMSEYSKCTPTIRPNTDMTAGLLGLFQNYSGVSKKSWTWGGAAPVGGRGCSSGEGTHTHTRTQGIVLVVVRGSEVGGGGARRRRGIILLLYIMLYVMTSWLNSDNLNSKCIDQKYKKTIRYRLKYKTPKQEDFFLSPSPAYWKLYFFMQECRFFILGAACG